MEESSMPLSQMEEEFNDMIGELDQILHMTSKKSVISPIQVEKEAHIEETLMKDDKCSKDNPYLELKSLASSIPQTAPTEAINFMDGLRGWGNYLTTSLQQESLTLLSTPTSILSTENSNETARQRKVYESLSDQGVQEITVNAGDHIKIPFLLSPNQSLTWKLVCQHFDIDFKVVRRVAAAGGAVERVLKSQKCLAGKVYSGGILPTADAQPRHVSLVLDNSTSRFRPKMIKYCIVVGASNEMVYEVDVDEEANFISEKGGAEDSDYDHISSSNSGRSDPAGSLMTRLGAQAVQLAKRLQLHDPNDPDETLHPSLASAIPDEDDKQPSAIISSEIVESITGTVAQLGIGLMHAMKTFQLHDSGNVETENEGTTEISAVPPRAQGAMKFPSLASNYVTDITSKDRDSPALPPDVDISQWANKERFPSSEMATKHTSPSPSPTKPTTSNANNSPKAAPVPVAPLFLNPQSSISPDEFQRCWQDLEHTGENLAVTTAVSLLGEEEHDQNRFLSVLLAHLLEVGCILVARGEVEGGTKFYLYAEGLRLPITTPARLAVQFLCELIASSSYNTHHWVLNLTVRSSESRFLEEFVLALRVREIVKAVDDGSRGRGRSCALLGLDYY